MQFVGSTFHRKRNLIYTDHRKTAYAFKREMVITDHHLVLTDRKPCCFKDTILVFRTHSNKLNVFIEIRNLIVF